MLTHIHHIGIACNNLEESAAFYCETFGLSVVSREKSDDYGLAEMMLAFGKTELCFSYVQLLQPLSVDSPVGRFLARRGEGIHHVGYQTKDLEGALAELSSRGIQLIDHRPKHGSMGSSIAFLSPKSVGGVLTELVQVPHA